MSAPYVPSARQVDRERFRRRRTRRRATIAAVSTIVVLGVLVAVVVTSPGWDRVQATFFSPSDAAAAFPDVARSFWLNIRLFLVVEVLVLILGLVVAVIRVIPSPALAPLKLVAVVYADVFRGTPTLLIVLLVGFGVPALQLAGAPTSLFWLGTIALTLSYGAYVAEVIRAGIQSVHATQWAAGRAIGLSYGKTLRYVVLPQAIRRVGPPLLNDFVSLQKDTALLSTIGLVESLRAAQVISGRDFVFTPYVVAACFFIVATIPLARLTDHLTVRSLRRENAL
ncbi:amino acid ABC transporter permease [Williamsia deligens]|uniref:Amino acid ABC transporter permease n=1 Tax=Williamsia deligens TaxID=321325 RepID=A0ABW3G806_9NOCA|nr:amino acid ABC transporter permease [Williamsia deligens]MCP2192501.1 amino acid ABC transporter membrane protein, PAAT family (TC 3.A.1.3.-) [Williamsia deligens]